METNDGKWRLCWSLLCIICFYNLKNQRWFTMFKISLTFFSHHPSLSLIKHDQTSTIVPYPNHRQPPWSIKKKTRNFHYHYDHELLSAIINHHWAHCWFIGMPACPMIGDTIAYYSSSSITSKKPSASETLSVGKNVSGQVSSISRYTHMQLFSCLDIPIKQITPSYSCMLWSSCIPCPRIVDHHRLILMNILILTSLKKSVVIPVMNNS